MITQHICKFGAARFGKFLFAVVIAAMFVSSCSSNDEFRIEALDGYEQVIPGEEEREQWPSLFAPLQPGHIEVSYYFAYACEHCFAFEPHFQRWLEQPRGDSVRVRKVPVGLRPEWVDHARLFYAAQSQDLVDPLHRPLFDAIHTTKPALADKAEALAEFAAESVGLAGGNADSALQLMQADAVAQQIMQDNLEVRAWRLSATPTVSVRIGGDQQDSFFRITNSTAIGHGGIIPVLDRLLDALTP